MQRDVSHLIPMDGPNDEEVPRWIFETLRESAGAYDNKPTAFPGTDLRYSSAGTLCLRSAWYDFTEVEKTNPTSTSDYLNMNLGTAVHLLLDQLPSTNETQVWTEVPSRLAQPDSTGGIWTLSGSADLVVTHSSGGPHLRDDAFKNADRIQVIEFKTMGGWGYKRATIPFQGQPPTGPKWSHWVQLAVNMLGIRDFCGTDQITGHLVYWAKDLISKDWAKDIGTRDYPKTIAGEDGDQLRIIAGWTMDLDLARRVVEAHVPFVLDALDSDRVPPRQLMADGENPMAIVTNPTTKRTTEGKTWVCGYCPYLDRCLEDGM